MADNSLGLLFEIDADPSKAQAALGSLGPQVEQFGSRVTGSMAQPRESARLLSEVFGVHMPRAITSAIGRMEDFQAVASTAFAVGAGVFAVEALVRYGKELAHLIETWNSDVEAQKRMTAAVKENEAAMAAWAQTGLAAAQQVTKNFTVEASAREKAAEGYRAFLEIQKESLTLAGVAALVWERVFNKQADLDKAAAEAREKATAAIKAQGEVGAKTAAQLEATLLKEQTNEYNAVKISTQQWNAWEKQADEALKKITADAFAADAALNKEFFEHLAAKQKILTDFNKTVGDSATDMSNYPDYVQPASAALSDFGEVLDRVTNAIGIQHFVSKEAAESMVANNLMVVGDSILGRQKMAVIEAIVETAMGFSSLGHGNFWGAAQHFTAAATWGSIAGTGSGARYGAGGQGAFGGGGRGERGGGGEFGVSSGPSAPTTVSPTAGGVVQHFHIQGLISEGTLAELAVRMNRAVYKGDVHLISSTTLGPSTPLS